MTYLKPLLSIVLLCGTPSITLACEGLPGCEKKASIYQYGPFDIENGVALSNPLEGVNDSPGLERAIVDYALAKSAADFSNAMRVIHGQIDIAGRLKSTPFLKRFPLILPVLERLHQVAQRDELGIREILKSPNAGEIWKAGQEAWKIFQELESMIPRESAVIIPTGNGTFIVGTVTTASSPVNPILSILATLRNLGGPIRWASIENYYGHPGTALTPRDLDHYIFAELATTAELLDVWSALNQDLDPSRRDDAREARVRSALLSRLGMDLIRTSRQIEGLRLTGGQEDLVNVLTEFVARVLADAEVAQPFMEDFLGILAQDEELAKKDQVRIELRRTLASVVSVFEKGLSEKPFWRWGTRSAIMVSAAAADLKATAIHLPAVASRIGGDSNLEFRMTVMAAVLWNRTISAVPRAFLWMVKKAIRPLGWIDFRRYRQKKKELPLTLRACFGRMGGFGRE